MAYESKIAPAACHARLGENQSQKKTPGAWHLLAFLDSVQGGSAGEGLHVSRAGRVSKSLLRLTQSGLGAFQSLQRKRKSM